MTLLDNVGVTLLDHIDVILLDLIDVIPVDLPAQQTLSACETEPLRAFSIPNPDDTFSRM